MTAESANLLPRATLLNYLGPAGMTPTRVRLMAARFVRVIAVLYLLLAGFFAYATISDFLRLYMPHSASLKFAVADFMAEEAPLPIFAFILLTLAAFLWAMASGVKNGRNGPAIIAIIMVIPLGLMLFGVGTLLTAGALVAGLGIGGPKGSAQPLWLLLLIPVAFLLVACLLIKDLVAYLYWIAHHPDAEKPKVEFLTGKHVS